MAKVKVKVDTRKLKANLDRVTPVIQRRTSRFLKTEIISFIKRGVSPVKGRFERYSDSYRAVIQNKAAFFIKGGKTVAITRGGFQYEFVDDIDSITGYDRGLKKVRRKNKANKNESKKRKFIKQFNSELASKRVSPVNLTVSGKMLNSFKVKNRKGGISLFFTSKTAAYHNNGTDKIPRRAMLPTEQGEEFNRNITLRLREIATKTIKEILG